MIKTLCGKCAHKRSQGGEYVQKVAGGVNEKVICEDCNRRRYGGTYEVSGEKKRDALSEAFSRCYSKELLEAGPPKIKW